MPPGPVRAVMLFVDDPRAVAAWYAAAFDVPTAAGETPSDEFACLDVRGVELAFHRADPVTNPPGRSTVVYWSVASVSVTRAHLLERGATALRGPLRVDDLRTICQLVDPFGNALGLDGPQ